MNPEWWKSYYNGSTPSRPLETPYPLRTFTATNFTDPDTDGDGILDGADDEDQDGFSNAYEVSRIPTWQTDYISTAHAGTNAKARVNPFNPCKPYYSNACHIHEPLGAYPDTEDWASPVHQNGP
jgi:hypothetical protein